ncbi:pyridoxamine 5'-phosphate oxidase family protein [Phytomonospora sp. NPDC050363]|uniref:pyridoxamine 5'-phosphate oxidase family protein n=1 Tax=Phytomonospora sp. NPDC050363 TaxID=3155642 RepID=UPI0033C87630
MSKHADIARELIAQNTYMALGTADAAGEPWVSPVFYTPDGHHDFYWVSSPETLHSRNIAVRPRVAITIFDSRCAIGTAEAVYMSAEAAPVPDGELAAAVGLFNAKLPEGRRFGPEELRAPALFRLYRATVLEHSILIRGGDPELGPAHDSRLTVRLP